MSTRSKVVEEQIKKKKNPITYVTESPHFDGGMLSQDVKICEVRLYPSVGIFFFQTGWIRAVCNDSNPCIVGPLAVFTSQQDQEAGC